MVEGMNAEAGIIGQRRQTAGTGCRQRLDRGVGLKGGAGLIGYRQAELAGREDFYAEGREHRGDLARLAAIVGGHDQLGQGEATRHQFFPLLIGRPSFTDRQPLQARQLADALFGERHQFEELRLAERLVLRRALDLDDAAVAGQHEIGVGLGL